MPNANVLHLFFSTEWTLHSVLVFFSQIPVRKWGVRRTPKTKHQEEILVKIWSKGQQGKLLRWQMCWKVSTQEYFCPVLLFKTRTYFCAEVWRALGKRGDLISYSDCQLEGTHSHHPDKWGPLQIRARGWLHLSGLHRLQNSLERHNNAEDIFKKVSITS